MSSSSDNSARAGLPSPAGEGQGTCLIRTLATLVGALRAWGIDVEAVLSRADLRSDQVEDLEFRIMTEQHRIVWEAAREITGDEAIGLHVLDEFDPHNVLSAYVYLASSSATAREAFDRVAPFIRVAHESIRLDLSVMEGRTICRAEFEGWEGEPMMSEYFLGLVSKIAPAVVGPHLSGKYWFKHARPAYADEYARVFGADVVFDAPFDAIVGFAADLDLPLPNADSVLCGFLERQARDALARMPKVSSYSQSVRDEIARQLSLGVVSADEVARALGSSPRTLRRRLKESGVTYQELLDSVRCDRAREALARPGASVGEVAFALGFSDTSAFHKAFRRWTGMRPSEAVFPTELAPGTMPVARDASSRGSDKG